MFAATYTLYHLNHSCIVEDNLLPQEERVVGLYILRDAFQKGEESVQHPFIPYLVEVLGKDVSQVEKQFLLRLNSSGAKYRAEFGKKLASKVLTDLESAEQLPVDLEEVSRVLSKFKVGNSAGTPSQRPVVLDPERGKSKIVACAVLA